MGADCSITRIEQHTCEEKCTKKCLADCKDTGSVMCFTTCNSHCMGMCERGTMPEAYSTSSSTCCPAETTVASEVVPYGGTQSCAESMASASSGGHCAMWLDGYKE